MTYIILAILALAGLWDLYAIRRWGLEGGKTLSWLLYSDSRSWPALAFLAGYGCHALTGGAWLVFLFGCVAGHIFGTMRGAT